MSNTASGASASPNPGVSNQSAILFVIALTLAAIGSLAWKAYDDLKNERRAFASELQLQSQSLSALFETSLESAALTLTGVAERLEFDDHRNTKPLGLRQRILRSPSLTDLRTYDAQGRLTERAALSPLASNTLPVWIQTDQQHGRSTGFGTADGELTLFHAARSADGQLLGTVVATLAADYFQGVTYLNTSTVAKHSFLVDPDGHPILHVQNGSPDSNPVDEQQWLGPLDSPFGGHGSLVQELGAQWVTLQQLRNHPIRLVQIAPGDIVHTRWHSDLAQSLVPATFILVAALFFVRYLRRAERVNQQLTSDLHRMNLVIEQSPVPIVMTDLLARVTYVNPAFTQSTGYTAEDMLGQNPRRLQSGKTNAATYHQLWAALQSGLAWRGQLLNSRKDGSTFWEESFIAPLRDIQGRTTHYFAVKIDISQRKAMEEALLQTQVRLQASHDLLDRLSQHVPGVIYQYRQNPDGSASFPYASNGVRDILGLNPIDFQTDATAFYARVHPQDLMALRISIQVSANTLTPWQQEFRVRHASGAICWLSGLAKPMLLDDGSILWHGFTQDVTERKLLEQIALEHARDMNTILENSTVGIVFVKDRRQIWGNRRMAEMFGYSMQESQGQTTRMYYPSSADYDALGQEGYAIMATGVRFVSERPMLHKQGHMVWMRLSGKAVDPGSIAAGSIWVFEDISEQKRLENSLKRAASVFTSAREGILIADVHGNTVDVNRTFSEITGYSREEMLGQNPSILKSGRQRPEFYVALWNSLADKGHWYGEVWNRRKNGEIYAEMLAISTVCDAAGNIENYVALFSDITTQKEHQQQLEHIAHFDALTQLPNRVLLADRLQQSINQCQRRNLSLAVVFLDLDGFKSVNDKHGHATGDLLLIDVSQRIKTALREGDTLARIGGDEFVAILVDLERPEDCEQVLARMLQAASDTMVVDGKYLKVSTSMGVTLYPQDGTEADLLMRQADQAMYAAKQAGKNRFHLFDVAKDVAIKDRREHIGHIREALNKGEFVLHYQPKVNMQTGLVVGAEALIRWQHPVRGLLAPADFLPVIEEHALSINIGEWVIATALQQMAQWQIGSPDFTISVNIGARQLQSEDFAHAVQQLLLQHPAVPAHCLQLEILETSALQDVAKVGNVITNCRGFGVSFALDDFGTGYSSLTYLKHLPAQTLKIDQSFVRDMLEDPSDLAIVTGVIGLARAFGREVVAEGVETAAHRDLLLSLDCCIGQGYGIARAMAAADFPGWMERWQASPQWLPPGNV